MTRSAAIELAPGVWRIPTVGAAAVNSYALVDGDGSVTLVDCGLKSAPPRILAGLAAMGKAPADVTRILLTHAHIDHLGGAAEMMRATGAPLAVHTADVPFAETGNRPPSDPSTAAGRLMNRLPGMGFPPVQVGRRLVDGDVLPVGGGLRVIHTPGHSPGHMSLLHESTRVLITGDALVNMLGIRMLPRPMCADYTMTQHSADVLSELDYDIAAFTHGEQITERARERVRGFVTAHLRRSQK